MGGAIASGCDKGLSVDCCCCLEQGENAFILVAALATAALALDGVGRANSFKIEKERNVILFFSSSLSYVTRSLLIGHCDVGGVSNDVSDVAEQF